MHPDPEIRGGGLRASVWSKNKGGGGGLPGRSPGPFSWICHCKRYCKIKNKKIFKPWGLYCSKALFKGLIYGGKFAFEIRLG